MKRNILGIIFPFVSLVVAILIVILLNSLPIDEDASVFCRDFNIEVELLDNGDAITTYTLDTHVNDSYSVRYFTFDNPYDDYSMEVLSLYINDKEYTRSLERAPFSDMNPTDYYYMYYFGTRNGEYIIEYYFPRNSDFDQKIVLDLKFGDFVKVYEDYADLYFMIANNYDFPIKNIKVDVKLPVNVESDELYAYGYGPVDGIISDDKLSFEASNIDSNERFEIRLLAPSTVFKNAPKLSGEILDEVLKENEIALDYVKKDSVVLYASIILAALINVIVVIYNIYIKSKFPRFIGINQGSINHIPDMDPILAGKLYRFYGYDFSNDLFVAALLNLANKKIISIEASENKKKPFMTYKLLDNNPYKLTDYEKDIIDLLFNTISPDNVVVTDKDIEKFGKKDPSMFSLEMTTIKSGFTALFNKQNWVDNSLKKYNGLRFLPGLLNVLLILTAIVIANVEARLTNWIFMLILGIINLFISLITVAIISGGEFKRLNKKGEDKLSEISEFANYLQDYTLLNEKLVQDIVMWENYLVYAVALGIAEKVIKQLEKKYDTIKYDSRTQSSYLYTFMVMRSYGVSPYSTISNIGKVTFSPQRYVSSSGGGKGGFSSGGGGGRGGGGSGGR